MLPFAAIEQEDVDSDSAGSETVEQWRERKRAFFDGCRDEMAFLLGEPGWRLTDDEPMVVLRFERVG